MEENVSLTNTQRQRCSYSGASALVSFFIKVLFYAWRRTKCPELFSWIKLLTSPQSVELWSPSKQATRSMLPSASTQTSSHLALQTCFSQSSRVLILSGKPSLIKAQTTLRANEHWGLWHHSMALEPLFLFLNTQKDFFVEFWASTSAFFSLWVFPLPFGSTSAHHNQSNKISPKRSSSFWGHMIWFSLYILTAYAKTSVQSPLVVESHVQFPRQKIQMQSAC